MGLETYRRLLSNLFTWERMFCKKWAEEIQIWRCIIAHSIFIGHAHDMTVIKEINNKTKIEFGRGVYINSKDILSNMEEYTLLSGSLIKDILPAL